MNEGFIPTLETDRLRLRAFREADVEPLFALMQDPDVVRYIGDRRIPTRQECWRAIAGWLGHWQLRGYGLWAVEERDTHAFIGRIGIINPLDWPGPELAYTLGKAWWGRGYANEACQAALRWGFEERGFERLISLIDPANGPSIALATRLGETLAGESEVSAHRVLVYSIDKSGWESQQLAR